MNSRALDEISTLVRIIANNKIDLLPEVKGSKFVNFFSEADAGVSVKS